MNTCRSCGAAIRWAKTPAGKRIPLDAIPDRARGNVRLGFIGGEELAIVLAPGADLEAARIDGDLFLSHFATCPKASEHRRPRTPEKNAGGNPR